MPIPQSRGPERRRRHPMNTATTITYGDMVMLDADGMARVAAALASNLGVVGIAAETVTNSGADGASYIEVIEGEFLLAGTTLEQADVGQPVYAESASTVDETAGANEPIAGILTEFVSASQGWVAMSLVQNRILGLGCLLYTSRCV